MGSRGLPMDVRKKCPCGAEFLTTKGNVLGLCPACMRERNRANSREHYAHKVTDCAAPEPPRRRAVPHDSFGPEYGFASVGDLYLANDGRMVGKRLRMDLMRVPQAERPRGVLEAA